MARSIEALVQDTIGGQALAILRLTADNESLHERVKELEAAAEAVKLNTPKQMAKQAAASIDHSRPGPAHTNGLTVPNTDWKAASNG